MRRGARALERARPSSPCARPAAVQARARDRRGLPVDLRASRRKRGRVPSAASRSGAARRRPVVIKRSKNGERVEVYSRRNGKKVYIGTFDSEREAIAAERRFIVTQEQIASGELPPEHDAKRTLDEAVEEWLKSLKASGSRSHSQYDERMKAYILPKLGPVPIVALRKAQVMKWRDNMATQFAANTVNGSLTCLSSAFTYFVDQDWIPSNPVHGVTPIERKV